MGTVGAGQRRVLASPALPETASAPTYYKAGDMRFNGFFQARRGLEEHLYQGRINLIEYGVHRFLTSQANPNDGIWFGSARALWHCIGARRLTERQCRRLLETMEKKHYWRRFVQPRQKGNYPILIDKFLVTMGPNSGMLLNANATENWRKPVYETLRAGGLEGAHGGPSGGLQESTTEILDTREGKQKKKTIAQASPSPLFDAFWSSYPRKAGKPAAHRAWNRVRGSEIPDIRDGLNLWKATEQWQKEGGKFIPYPATFLNQRRWEDEPPQKGANRAEQRDKRNLTALGLD